MWATSSSAGSIYLQWNQFWRRNFCKIEVFQQENDVPDCTQTLLPVPNIQMVTVSVQLCPSQIRSVSRGSTSTTMRFKFFFSNHCTGLLFLTLKTFFIVHAKGEMTEEHNRPVMVRKFRNFWCCYKLLSYSTYHVNVALHNLNNSAKTWSVLPGGGQLLLEGEWSSRDWKAGGFKLLPCVCKVSMSKILNMRLFLMLRCVWVQVLKGCPSDEHPVSCCHQSVLMHMWVGEYWRIKCI